MSTRHTLTFVVEGQVGVKDTQEIFLSLGYIKEERKTREGTDTEYE